LADTYRVLDEEELAYSKLNILLSKDAVSKLDEIKENAGLVSRGRTIQELIEGYWDLGYDVKKIVTLFNANTKNPEKVASLIYPYLLSIVRRFAKLGLLDDMDNEKQK